MSLRTLHPLPQHRQRPLPHLHLPKNQQPQMQPGQKQEQRPPQFAGGLGKLQGKKRAAPRFPAGRAHPVGGILHVLLGVSPGRAHLLPQPVSIRVRVFDVHFRFRRVTDAVPLLGNQVRNHRVFGQGVFGDGAYCVLRIAYW